MRSIDYKQDTFVIVGAGDTGRSIYNYIRYRNANVLRVLDTRDDPPQVAAEIKVLGGPLNYRDLADASVIVISPGVSIYDPALRQALVNDKLIVGDIELFAQAINCWGSKVIGITGSNGKTTVTSLTGFLGESIGRRTLVAGNIGKPVLDALIEIEHAGVIPELIVLELSSFQLETTYSLKLDSATVLNISEDHLDRYRDLLEYAYAKANIFDNCKVQVLNQEDPLVMAMSRDGHKHIYFANQNAEYSLMERDRKVYLSIDGQLILDTEELQLVGRHNYLNCLASLALLVSAGYNLQDLLKYVTRFAGLEHRMQKIAEHNHILFIEDSKGTNVGAVIAGVGGIDAPVHLILGGDGKGQDFSPLRNLVENKCKSVALIGQDADKIAKVLTGIDNCHKFATLEEAVSACYSNAKPGDAVILSPACASWDMFDNYKHRAQVFIDTVYAAIQKNA